MSDLNLNGTHVQSGKSAVASQVTRRGFAALSAAGAVAACIGTAQAATLALSETRESIATPHGAADGWFVRPSTGRHPGVVMWSDSAAMQRHGLTVARRLAEQGFAVLVVERGYGATSAALSGTVECHQMVNRDARVLVAWIDAHSSVQPAGSLSSAMQGVGGGYSLRTISAAAPRVSLASRAERIAAAQSGMLFAVPNAAVARVPARMDKLSEAARLAYRAAA